MCQLDTVASQATATEDESRVALLTKNWDSGECRKSRDSS